MVLEEMKNYKGGITGIFGLIMIQALLNIIAFLTAFGNPSETAKLILHSIGLLSQIVLQPHMIPISYVIGCFTFNKKKEKVVF